MHDTDILIAGGGLAGSTAAAMLGRAGYRVVLVDPHDVYPPDLRCEKLIGRQVDILRRTGLADVVLAAATLDGECWIARFGRVVDRQPADQWGILYDTLVNTIRGAIPAATTFIRAKVVHIANSAGHQAVALSNGDTHSARLVILANGLNNALLQSLDMVREDVSRCHCVTLAYDVRPVGRSRFEFRALTYYPDLTDRRIAYLTLFPIGDVMRANLMVYRTMDDPWLKLARQHPHEALARAMPLDVVGRWEVAGLVKIRPADLSITRGHLQPGVVLVGDAFATTCPVTGTGADKVFTDVERLCNLYVPRWFATEGMGVDKIAGFYADPVKRACDRFSWDNAFKARSICLDDGLQWRARRWTRFVYRTALGSFHRFAQ